MLVFGFLGGYVKEEGMATGARYFLLELAQRDSGSAWSYRRRLTFAFVRLYLLGLSGGAGGSGFEGDNYQRPFDFDGGRFVSSRLLLRLRRRLMFLFSPHYAWYILWLVPFFTLMPNLPILTYVLGFLLSVHDCFGRAWAEDVSRERNSLRFGLRGVYYSGLL